MFRSTISLPKLPSPKLRFSIYVRDDPSRVRNQSESTVISAKVADNPTLSIQERERNMRRGTEREIRGVINVDSPLSERSQETLDPLFNLYTSIWQIICVTDFKNTFLFFNLCSLFIYLINNQINQLNSK